VNSTRSAPGPESKPGPGAAGHLDHGFQAGIHRLDEAGSSKGTPTSNLSTPSFTIQSITRTYCENPPPAGSKPASPLPACRLGTARRVCGGSRSSRGKGRGGKRDHPVARGEAPRRRPPGPLRRRLVPEDARRRQQVMFHLLQVGMATPQLSIAPAASPGPISGVGTVSTAMVLFPRYTGGPHRAAR